MSEVARRTKRGASRRPARRPARSRGARSGGAGSRALLFGLLLPVLLGLGAVGWLTIVYPAQEGPGRGRTVSVVLEPDLRSIPALSTHLAARGVISSPRIFSIYARLLGAEERLREGEVLLRDDMSPGDILRRLAEGFGGASMHVTVPEGFNRFQIAERLERWGVCSRADFLGASEDRALLEELEIPGPSAEGYLFPDTYRLNQGMAAEDALRQMVRNYRRRTASLFRERAEALRGLRASLQFTEHEVLTMASIVEKEAVRDEERPIIAGVFLNRLRDPRFVPHRLQADPTVAYGCREAPHAAPSCEGWDGRHITRAMLADERNPYNTYRHEGLPPGPISSPGLSTLRGVLEADARGYLYFVARGRGRHAFSRTLEEHNRAVARYRASQ